VMFFMIDSGSLCCVECEKNGRARAIDRTLLSAMRHIVYSKMGNLYSFEIPEKKARELEEITGEYITMQTDHRFSTLEFYNSIKEK